MMPHFKDEISNLIRLLKFANISPALYSEALLSLLAAMSRSLAYRTSSTTTCAAIVPLSLWELTILILLKLLSPTKL